MNGRRPVRPAEANASLETWSRLYRSAAPRFHEFETEAAAQDFVAHYLRPYCARVVREPVFKSGLRPDLGFRVNHERLKHFPIAVEVKKFRNGGISELAAAVRQAHSYANETGFIAVVGPVNARGPSHLAWNASPIGAVGLVAAQFSVGYLYCDETGSGGVFIGGQSAVRFLADGSLSIHSDAETLLTKKNFAGSSTWRNVA